MRKDRIRIQTAVFILTALCVNLFACRDPSADTELTVVNKSSHDLHVVFEHLPPYYGGFNVTIDVNKGETISLIISESFGWEKEHHYNPNEGGTKIIISSLIEGEIGEIIKEMDTMDKSVALFEFLGYRDNYYASYRFTITDDLLRD